MNAIYRLQETFRSELTADTPSRAHGRFACPPPAGFDIRPRRLSQHAPAVQTRQLIVDKDLTDHQLISAVKRGSAVAGEILVARYSEALHRYLLRAGSRENAEELFQQTWLCVLNHLDSFDLKSAPGGFKAWLFRIATNKINDLWRSRGRERLGNSRLAEILEPYAERSSHHAEVAEEVSKLRQCLAELPDKQREVLVLKYFANLKFVEIAETLGCPLNTALGHAHKGILKLRKLMGVEELAAA